MVQCITLALQVSQLQAPEELKNFTKFCQIEFQFPRNILRIKPHSILYKRAKYKNLNQ